MGEHGVNAIHLKPLSTYELIPELHHHKALHDDQAGKMLAEAEAVAKRYDLSLHTKPFESAPVEREHAESATEIIDIVDLKNHSRGVVQVRQMASKNVRRTVPLSYTTTSQKTAI
jgi:hypothetical protein